MRDRMARVTAAVLGCLIENPQPMRQTEIAIAVEATQARVSQVLNETDRSGLTARSRQGWQVTHPATAFDTCMTQISRRTTIAGWYSLESGPQQIESCIDTAQRNEAEYRVSGDWAADRLAPWRIPRLAIIHIDQHLDLETAGFVPSKLADATLHAVVGPIPQRWRADPRIATQMAGSLTIDWHFAPVHDIAHQILAAGGPDAPEAVSELRDQFLMARSTLAAGMQSA